MRTSAWTVAIVAFAMNAVFTCPMWVRANDPCEPISAETFQFGASLEAASSPTDPTATEYLETECSSGCTRPSDTWCITADALLLQRRDPTAAALVVNAIDDTEYLNASDFDFGMHAGFDLSLTRRLGERLGIEVRYFGVDQWATQSTALTPPGSLLQVNSSPPVFAWAGTSIEAQHASELQNVEINGQCRVLDRWKLLAGFRYAELDEHFAAAWIDAPAPFHYDTATRNRLYGFQIGGAGMLWDRGGPLSIEAVGKAGIFGNAAAHDSVYSTGLVAFPARGTASETAFIGELGFTGNYRLTDHLSVRGGYRLLWIDGVALATDQVAASDFIFDRGIDTTGDAFYHGAFVGLQYVR